MSDAISELYPEHAKLMKVTDKSQAIGEFIEFGGYVLAIEAEEADCWLDCEQDHPHLKAVSKPITTVLAEYFGIDEGKVEVEKRAMLEAMREMNS